MIGSKHLFKAEHKNRLPIIDYQNNVPGIELFLLGMSAYTYVKKLLNLKQNL